MPFNSDVSFEKAHATNSNFEASRNFAKEAYEGTAKFVDSCATSALILTLGPTAGALDAATKDPIGTVAKAGATFVVGAGLGALAVAESPVFAGTALVIGGGLTLGWAVDTLNPFEPRNQERYHNLGTAMRDTWEHPSNSAIVQRSLQTVRENAGPIALDVAFMGLGCKGAQFGAKHVPGFVKNLDLGLGKQLVPSSVPNSVPNYFEGKSFPFGDFSFLKARSGRAKVDIGPPETLDARLAARDQALNIKAANNNSNSGNMDNVKNLLPAPQDPSNFAKKTFYFPTRYGH